MHLRPWRQFALALSAVATIVLGADTPAVAQQKWPTRPIKLLISQPAGGTPDIICRLVAAGLSKELDQSVYVDNRGGGAGIIGMQAAAQAEPDGYTLVFGVAAPLTSHLYTFKSLPYDPEKDFTPIAMVAQTYFFILTHPSVKANSLAELIAMDKQSPGKLSLATDAPKSYAGLLAQWLNYRANTKFNLVPYSNMNQGVQDAIAGRVEALVLGSGVAPPYMQSNQLRPLAVSSPKRLERFPTVPTIAETLPGVDFAGWFVLLAPRGTPEAIVTRVNSAMAKVMESPEMTEQLAKLGAVTSGAQTPEATLAFLTDQRQRWHGLATSIGVQPD